MGISLWGDNDLAERSGGMKQKQISMLDVSFSYEDKKDILKEITFEVSENESIGIIGANGVGKSTLLKLLVGLNTGYRGKIYIDDILVNKKNIHLVREKIGYVFQESDNQLFMSTVYDDVAFAPKNYGFPDEEVERRVNEALNMVGIEHLKGERNYKLSGGEKKLVSIATVLSMKPNIILMDEPSASLDPRNRRNLINILNEFNHLKLIASHDLDFILDTCERTILMYNGRIVKDAKTKDILNDKKILEENGLELPLRYYK